MHTGHKFDGCEMHLQARMLYSVRDSPGIASNPFVPLASVVLSLLWFTAYERKCGSLHKSERQNARQPGDHERPQHGLSQARSLMNSVQHCKLVSLEGRWIHLKTPKPKPGKSAKVHVCIHGCDGRPALPACECARACGAARLQSGSDEREPLLRPFVTWPRPLMPAAANICMLTPLQQEQVCADCRRWH